MLSGFQDRSEEVTRPCEADALGLTLKMPLFGQSKGQVQTRLTEWGSDQITE